MKPAFFFSLAVLFPVVLLNVALAQDADSKQKTRTLRELSRQGNDGIAKVAAYGADVDPSVRAEMVKALVEIGGPKTVEALVKAAADNDPEVQIRAADGLVNVYLPGYVKTGGLSATLSRAGAAVKAKFTDTNDQVIEPFVKVSRDVIAALSQQVKGGASLDSRANAARAVGVLRGNDAIPELIDALHSKDDKLMYESMVALQKIGDPSAAPRISFLLNDLEEKIQIEALETTGLLRNKAAAPRVRDALTHARGVKVRRAALVALGQIADPADHPTYLQYLSDKDDSVRAAALEGIGRLKNSVDRATVTSMYNGERAMGSRLAAAFALVSLGELNLDRYGPLQYLINGLNQRTWSGVASAYLIELARDPTIRTSMYPLLGAATKDEKIQMAIILSHAGDRDSVGPLEALSKDTNSEVAAEGVRSLRVLRARLP